MSHRSRFCALIIDSKVDDLRPAAEFWSKALGAPIAQDGQLEQGLYAKLEFPSDQPVVEVQKVDHDSRVHLDIETDDVEAEVRRLERLGAKRLRDVRTFVVMEAPTGHRFCVVRAQRPDFAERANRWE
jgi:predicted enzyme related to lactoylglutathione lyase